MAMLSSHSISECPRKSSMQPPGTTEYHVQGRDTLRSIAVAFNTTTSTLMQLNKMNSTCIFPDQILFVPDIDEDLGTEQSNSPHDILHMSDKNFDDDFAFLAPLSATSPLAAAQKPFQDLVVVSVRDPPTNSNNKIKDKSSFSLDYAELLDIGKLGSDIPCTITSPQHDVSNHENVRERIMSNESCKSEEFEENFLKMTVHYITSTQNLVKGVLLVTPTSVMFDPDPNDPLVVEHGCEKFGIMCLMSNIASASMFNNKTYLHKLSVSSDVPSLARKTSDKDDVEESVDCDISSPTSQCDNTDNLIDLSEQLLSGCSENILDNKEDVGNIPQEEMYTEKQEDKLMHEFPLIHSLFKTVGDYLPGHSQNSEESNTSRSPNLKKEDCMYFCVCSQAPMMKTFSTNQASHNSYDEKKYKEGGDGIESWFQVQRRRSDQLLAFFMQWSPDPYTLDFAEQNGFIVTDSLTDTTISKYTKHEQLDDDKRSRSSTNTSLEFVENFFSDMKIEKEWEIVSVEEARRRSTLSAVELANDDTSLIPELMNSSNLITDDTLLAICKHLPARSVGYAWKLLYSTFEHGMSLRTLYRKMNRLAEDSPVVLLIQDNDNHTFGAFCSCRPRVSEHFYGTGESFLFTLEPTVQFFDWSGENNFYIKGDTDALTVGGGDGLCGLWIDGDLIHGSSHPCLTFNNSVLSSTEDFFIQGVEVWGFSDS